MHRHAQRRAVFPPRQQRVYVCGTVFEVSESKGVPEPAQSSVYDLTALLGGQPVVIADFTVRQMVQISQDQYKGFALVHQVFQYIFNAFLEIG